MMQPLGSEMRYPPHRSELDKFALSRSMKNRPTSCLVTRTRRILTTGRVGHRATAANRNYND